MQSVLRAALGNPVRNRLAAAAMLLVPLAALLVSNQAQAQHFVYVQPAQPPVVAQPHAEYYGDRYGDRYSDRYSDREGDRHGNRHDRYADRRGPEIRYVTPEHGERVGDRGRTRISAHYGDFRSGVDLASVRLRVDGRDVTRFARFDDDSIHYREDLAPGRHVAELSLRDRAGNVSRRNWSFDVVNPNWRPGYGSGAQVIGQRW